ncbi:MAG TPA: NADH-quinone oxidoreductase subunit H [Candidatus Omnitrophota bacterium]|nr:NADH-quinone oxidoreductase subunit H [Candidatus Omnitrophota bacterium]
MNVSGYLNIFLALVFSPFLFGVINRTKAFFAGRHGQPIFQLYFDLGKLLRKGAVYSRTTTWIFRGGPIIGLAALLMATAIVPGGKNGAVIAFSGDVILFIYLLGLVRFFAVLAALDTGSSFEGMGASREVQFALFAEPAIFLALAVLARRTGQISLSGIYADLTFETWQIAAPVLALVAGTILIVFLAENARIPVDDPNTHLELTMIHEVMVLDHGGVDLGIILYASALKFWLLGSLFIGLVVPLRTGNAGLDAVVFLAGMTVLGIIVGAVESVMARVRLLKVPNLLLVALLLSVLALIFGMR